MEPRGARLIAPSLRRHLLFGPADDICNPYCILQLDNRARTEVKTAVCWNTSLPFWSEEFIFEDLDDLRKLSFVIWNSLKNMPDTPIAKLDLPRCHLLNDGDQWFSLMSNGSEGSAHGEIRLRSRYYPPMPPERAVATVSVQVIAARNLAPQADAPRPFVTLHLLPDPSAESTQQTKTQPPTRDPVFSAETFIFPLKSSQPEQELHVSVWNENLIDSEMQCFLGHLTVPVAQIVEQTKESRSAWLDRWYPLLPRPHITMDEKKGIFRKKLHSEEERRNRPRALIKALQSKTSEYGRDRRAHTFFESRTAMAYCIHCGGILVESHLQCSECQISSHYRCRDLVYPSCGSAGTIRIKWQYNESFVLPLPYYEPMLNLLYQNDYALLMLIGKVSPEREDAAKCLVRIFETNGNIGHFLRMLLRNEIRNTPSAKTLFRGNSMASKALDVYMKHVGLNYLQSVLKGVLQNIIEKNQPCEIDPVKLEKADSKVLRENIRNLTQYNFHITEAIFGSFGVFPGQLREIFEFIQNEVQDRFSDTENVRYTSVTGFIFLRFFAPAVLCPRLFGIDLPPLDARSNRTLVLSAKVLQNMSNLVTFGQKEQCMEVMNSFILDRMKGLKTYVDEISSPNEQVLEPVQREVVNTIDCDKEASELYGILSRSISKMTAPEYASAQITPLVQNLDIELQRVASILEEKAAFTKIVLPTTPFVIGEDVLPTEALGELEHEISTENMVNAYSSMSNNTAIHGQRSSFRHSVDLAKDASGMVRTLDRVSHDSHRSNGRNSGSDSPQLISGSPDSSGKRSGPLAETKRNLPKEALEKIRLDLANIRLKSHRSRGALDAGLHKAPSLHPTPSMNSALSDPSSGTSSAFTANSIGLITTCFCCNGAIPPNTAVVNFESRTWLATHFNCSKCHRSLKHTNAYLSDNALYCEEHIKSRPADNKCNGCGLPIMGPIAEADGKRYHALCLICNSCGINLTSTLIPYEGQIFCRNCYLWKIGLVCAKCKELIQTEYFTVNGENFHVDCRTCDQCGSQLAGKEYFTLGDQVFCLEHRGNVIRCRECHQHIDGEVLIALESQSYFHIEHFNCRECQRNLATQTFFEIDDQPYCKTCYLKNSTV
ncbi:uncharacterized protein BJ171DRAFT_132827 [Polychytrium aggregatum]|uniref:uncharacterized protein n=1 Tax=Polychytrium aggregatum TaxID=110093 RepID=UPI0022FE3826|nr:uncharacterized protein BJ171DRAFT_132827 [Polychytrium aggregatum]KAI9203776.1 hypothetical protein BJ171DRAFT_132827 [Polychytrium aggregatum]